jgi:hypothetical protein
MKTYGKRLLITFDTCLITLPTLANQLGRNEALFLQQLHFWLSSENSNGISYDGKKWIYNTYEDWKNQFKIFSLSTIRRIIKKLEKLEVIYSKKLGKKQSDQTKWYTINYEVLSEIIALSLENPHMFKMNSPCVQNEQIIHKETEITSENKSISSEGVALEKQQTCSQQVNYVKTEIDLKIKNNLASELLEIWNQTVGQGDALVQLTKKRAQHLVAAFKYRFESSLEKWRYFCRQVISSEFLMGKVKETFRASLDWVLRFDIIQRIVEGDFGIKLKGSAPEEGSDAKTLENLQEEIVSNDETDEVKTLRGKILQQVGGTVYQTWFRTLRIYFDEQEKKVVLQALSSFTRDWIESHYRSDLRPLTSFNLCFSEKEQETLGALSKRAIPSQTSETAERETIMGETPSSDEPSDVQAMRQKIFQGLGENLYTSWFKNLEMVVDEQGRGVKLQAQSQFAKDYIETHYLKDLCSLTSKDVHIFC